MSIRDEIIEAILSDENFKPDAVLAKYANKEEVNKFMIDLCGYSLVTFFSGGNKDDNNKENEEI